MLRALCLGFALAGLLAVWVSPVFAACARYHRVPVGQADCLDGAHEEVSSSRVRLWAQNVCPELGSVVAKWDLIDRSDRTWTLSGGDRRTSTMKVAGVRGLFCCQDKGLCSRRDRSARPGPYREDAAGCRAQWARSGAAKRCDLVSVVFKRGADPWCRITARCDALNHRRPPRTERVYRSVKIKYVDELKWCPQHLPDTALVYHDDC